MEQETAIESRRAPRTAGQMLARGKTFLAAKGVAEARLESELLVAHALGLSRLQLFLELDRPVDAGEVAGARALLMRRARGEPSAYLVGAREFYGRRFRVGPGVLVPRPETELVVDLARELAAERGAAPAAATGAVSAGAPLRIAELGTGSGCIAITLALELPEAEVAASELSPEALVWARANAEDHAAGLGGRLRLIEGDGLAPLAAAWEGGADLLVSNPPYVDPADAAGLAREVRESEPALALFAPAGVPDHWLERLLVEGRRMLRPGGALAIELGAGQAPRARDLCRREGLSARTARDLAGIERVLVARPAR